MNKEIQVRIEQINAGIVPEGYKKTKFGIVPSEWEEKTIEQILTKISKPVTVDLKKQYIQIGIRSHGKGIFIKDSITGQELGSKSVFWIEPHCLIFNIVFAWEQAVAKTTPSEIGLIASHRFPMYLPKDDLSNIDYLWYFFMTKKGKDFLELASPGGAGRNKTLGQDSFNKSKLIIPSIEEQEKIAEILMTCDKVIELKEKLIIEKEKQKKCLMQNLLTGKKRLDGFNEKWEKKELGEILEYIQPTNYITDKISYLSVGTPVLTAGKSFILGYTDDKNNIFEDVPVIIFDDFTTSSKYADFPFKVRSSAMKILKVKETTKYSLNLLFGIIQLIYIPLGDHKRRWISEYSKIIIKIPTNIKEQQAIAEILSTADKEIELLKQDLEFWKQKKKGLMQLLLTGKVRTI